jgi:hypothetical protein
MQLIDDLLLYLYQHKDYALMFDGLCDQGLDVYTDASFGDDPEDRKSSQGWLMTLFGTPVAWRSNKQPIVTGSTTEAEILSFVSATKEAMELLRIFRDMNLVLDHPLKIFCDNKQAIRIITSEYQRLKTALKHVDIPQMWIRQEHKAGRVTASYLPSADMTADGLTKALPAQSHKRFVAAVRLVEIGDILLEEKD